MASIARFGFERGYIPSNVTMYSASFVVGRNSGTAVEATASGITEFGNVVNNNSVVNVSGIATDTIYYSCQFKRVSANSNVSMSLVQFGNVWVTYEPASSRVTFRRGKAVSPGYDILFTSPATVNLPVGTWVPVSGQFTISPTVGQISINIDSVAYSATNLNTSQAWSGTYTSNVMSPLIIPQGVSSITIAGSGAGGGGWTFGATGVGGAGGFVSGIFSVKPGQIYYAIAGTGGATGTAGGVGAGGSPGGQAGGGAQYAGGGGGYTGIFTSSIASTGSAVVVAGAGGGSQGGSGIPGNPGGNPAAAGAPLLATGAGGGAGYIGGQTNQGGSNFLRVDVTSQVNTQGGGAAGGAGIGNPGGNGSITVSAALDKTTLIFGLGVSRNNILVGTPTFQLDDVAVNNTYTATNATGSWGVADTNTPPFISAVAVDFTTTGSLTTGWTTPSGNFPLALSGSGMVTGAFYPRPLLQLKLNSNLPVSTVEGMNLYFTTASREGSSQVYISPNFALSSTSSIGAYSSFGLSSVPANGSVSIFEKDLGGKVSLSELNSGSVSLNSSAFVNKNFFGTGVDGDVRYSTSANLGDGVVDGDYVVMNYKNLIIDSGVTISTAVRKRGLVIYVQENCLINGTISMVTKGGQGTLPSGFLLAKNTASISFDEYTSSLYTLAQLSGEQTFQPFISGSTTNINIPISVAAGGVGNSPGQAGTNGGCGGGGGAQFTTTNGQAAQHFGGGWGSDGLGVGPMQIAGGVIYLIVGKNLILSGTITANGSQGTNGSSGIGVGGGTGAGSITILYGKNFINSGTVQANGGPPGTGGSFGGASGGAGSIRIIKIISN